MSNPLEMQTLAYATQHWIPQPEGKPVSRNTVWRWHRYGLNGVKLQICKVGRAPMVCEQWLQDFFNNIASAASPPEKKAAATVTERDFAEVGL